MEKLENYMPIKFGSSLYSKLTKNRYWDLEHVKGNPLVFAIADFHEANSMVWSHSALWQYLYGMRYEHIQTEDGSYHIAPTKILTHKLDAKEIPSGFSIWMTRKIYQQYLVPTVALSQNSIEWEN